MRQIDLTAWDNWLPLGIIAVFGALALIVYLDWVELGVAGGDVERFQTVYTDIGIQTTAGILAIIISLSLVAIQFAAQEYSHRIMEYYMKSVIFWSTFLVYLSVMVSGIVLQARSSPSDDTRIVSVLLVGTLLCLFLLIPHFLVTASYLKPEFIIRKLLGRVDQGYLSSLWEPGAAWTGRVAPSIDRLLPVVEITERSIDRGDLTTTRSALEQIYDLYSSHTVGQTSPEIDSYFLDHILRIGRKAATNPDEEEAAVQTIEMLGRIGKGGPAAAAVENIDVLGFLALRKDSDIAVAQMIDSLRQIFDVGSADVNTRILQIYGDLVRRLATGSDDRLLRQLTDHLFEISQSSYERGDLVSVQRCIDLIERVGYNAAVNGMVTVVLNAGAKLQNLATASAGGQGSIARGIVLNLLRIERAVPSNDRETVAVLEFARGEVERTIGSGSEPTEEEQGAGDSGDSGVDGDPLGLSGLWDKPKD